MSQGDVETGAAYELGPRAPVGRGRGRGRESILGPSSRAVCRVAGRTYPARVELIVIAATILAWQLLRIPFEGSVQEAISHARAWHGIESRLGIDVEAAVITFVREQPGLDWATRLLYGNLHVPMVVLLLVTARLRAPRRYPVVRTAFIVSHVFALVVLAVYPLAPPHWLEEMPYASGPPASDAVLRNATAASVSLHFGYAVFVAAVAMWLWPRSSLARVSLGYPVLVFAVIVGTGHHFVLDTLVGTASVAAAAAVACALCRQPAPGSASRETVGRTIAVAVAVALVGLSLNALVTGGWH